MAKQSIINLVVKGLLVKFGKIIDLITGRNWQPSSSLATSALIDKIKKLMEAELKEVAGAKFVPHKIWIKMQWDKFNLEKTEDIEALRNEILTAIVDYINDNRYHTCAPLSLDIKRDYFVEGVVLRVGFDDFLGEKAEIRIKLEDDEAKKAETATLSLETKTVKVIAEYDLKGEKKTVEIELKENSRISIGRAESNDLVINDPTVSKVHAGLLLNSEGQLIISDLGSSNGTFVNDERVDYGKAFKVSESDEIKFGTVKVKLRIEKLAETVAFSSDLLATKDKNELELLGLRDLESNMESGKLSKISKTLNIWEDATED